MSIGMLIIVLLVDQYSYDNFIERRKEIYRVQTVDNLSPYSLPRFASTTFPLAGELRKNYTFIEDATAVNNNFSGEVEFNNSLVRISGLYAEDNFFDMFSFKLIRGNREEALKEPYSIILKENTAKKFFGEEDPLGKNITIKDYGIFTVTGLIESNKLKSHIQFESLVSSSTLTSRKLRDKSATDYTSNWENFYSSYVYIIPVEGTDPIVINEALEEISIGRYSDNDKMDITYYLYPFDKIVPGPVIGNELGVSMPKIYLIFFGGLALVVIISAAFNYTSLSIARSLTRAKEFGIRKSIGASRKELIFQIFMEAIMISMISLVIGIGFLQLILPVFKGFNMMALMQVEPAQNFSVFLWFFCFALFTGIVAGTLPAIYISKINPVNVLKGSGNLKIFKRLTFRKILLVTQYFFSIVFIITIILIYRQMIFMVNADMGFERNKIYNIQYRDSDRALVEDILGRVPEVSSLSFGSHVPGIGNMRDSEVKLNDSDEEYIISNHFDVGPAYIETMGLKLIAGEDFPSTLSEETESLVLISELAVEKYNFESPVDAIGNNIIVDDTINLVIQGVFKNYKYCALFLPERPLLLRYRPNHTNYAVLRIQTGDLPVTVEKLKEQWKEIDAAHEMTGLLLDTEIRDFYVYFEDILYMVGYTAFLALMIASMGLYGMASYSIKTRTKEVGIRKVFGAETGSIVYIISKSFIKLLLISILLGAPAAFFLNNAWISFIASHVSFGLGTILSGVLIVAIIGILSISSQTIKVSSSNPAETLKYE